MPSTPTPPRPFDPYNAGRSAASLLAATELFAKSTPDIVTDPSNHASGPSRCVRGGECGDGPLIRRCCHGIETLFASSMGRPTTIERSGYGFGPYLPDEPGSSDQSTACSKTTPSWRPGLTPVSRSVLCWSPRCATTGGDQIESEAHQRAPRSPANRGSTR